MMETVPPHGPNCENAKRWVASIILTGIFCVIEVNRSIRAGALSLPTQYDDISYYLTGAEYLQTFYSNGISGLFRTYISNPPHAPLSTGLAFVGFSFLSIEAWSGPIINSALFLFFVRWFFYVSRGLLFFQSVILAVAFFGFPFVTLTVMSFRPDMFCSLLTACGMLVIVANGHWLTERRVQIVAGLLLAAALWSKPAVFHLSIALFSAAIFVSSLSAILHGNFKDPVRGAVVTLGTGILLSVPYYTFALRQVMDYIWTTAFGAESSIWVRPLPLRENILFYLTGDYGRASLGWWLFASPIIGASTIIVLWRSDRVLLRRSILIFSLVVITYLAVTIPTFKGPHGYPFAALVFVISAVASVALLQRMSKIVGSMLCCALLVFSAMQFSWPTPAVPTEYAKSRWAMVQQALDAIGQNVSGKTFLLTTSGLYLNYSILAFEYYRKGLLPPGSDNTQTVSDLEEQRRRIALADIVFALTPEFSEVFPHLPTASREMREQIIEAIENSHRFKLKSKISDPLVEGAAALIYVKSKEDFSEFSKVEGLRAIEGPYPHWNLPRVRWGWGSQSRLIADGKPGSQSQLVVEARTVGQPGQVITVLVNGQVKTRASLSDAFTPLQAIVDFDQQGHADIVLSYSLKSDNAALYKTISVEPLMQDGS